jgi:S1-C subfamily serine protease
LVVHLEKNSPALRAGLTEGDVIVGFDGEPISGIDDLHRVLTEEKVGIKTMLTILRRSEKLTLEIVPEESIRREDE